MPPLWQYLSGQADELNRLVPDDRSFWVRERAWLTVVEGDTRIEAAGDVVEAGPGTLVTFEPGERHSIGSEHGARIILILSPWPGEGHYPESDPWTILD